MNPPLDPIAQVAFLGLMIVAVLFIALGIVQTINTVSDYSKQLISYLINNKKKEAKNGRHKS